MKRRKFIGLAGCVAAWPAVARAQRQPVPTIGFLHAGAPDTYAPLVTAFKIGLRESGYIEGQNVRIEYRWAEGQQQRLQAMATELANLRVSVIVTAATVSMVAAKSVTSIIPIVFVTSDDPVKAGFVASLNRPGGNATGVNFLLNELGSKRFEILRELFPTANKIGFLVNPRSPPGAAATTDLEALVRRLGFVSRVEQLRNDRDVEIAFASLADWKADAAMVVPDGFVFNVRHQLVTEAARRAIPTIYPLRDFPIAGGLLSYGTSITETFKLMGNYTSRILKGEKPADLPVVQSDKFELVVNNRTAKALGLKIPESFLLRADEVIE